MTRYSLLCFSFNLDGNMAVFPCISQFDSVSQFGFNSICPSIKRYGQYKYYIQIGNCILFPESDFSLPNSINFS